VTTESTAILIKKSLRAHLLVCALRYGLHSSGTWELVFAAPSSFQGASAMAGTKKKMKTRTIAIIAGIGVAVAGGGIAFAYFTGVGSGSGTATAGSNNPIIVTQNANIPPLPLGPGVAPQTLSGKFTNANTGPVYVGSISAVVTAVSVVGTPAPPACSPSDFVIAGGTHSVAPNNNTWTIPIGREIAVGTAVDNWSGLTIGFVNKATNQDACKGAGVTITYTANAT
jgi:hypothetical protein